MAEADRNTAIVRTDGHPPTTRQRSLGSEARHTVRPATFGYRVALDYTWRGSTQCYRDVTFDSALHHAWHTGGNLDLYGAASLMNSSTNISIRFRHRHAIDLLPKIT